MKAFNYLVLILSLNLLPITSVNAGLISQTINASGLNVNSSFDAFNNTLGSLDSVTLIYDISFSGTIADNLCAVFNDCDGTRSLSVTLGTPPTYELTDLASVFVDNNEFSYSLNLSVSGVQTLNVASLSNWSSPVTFMITTGCLGDCFMFTGNAVLSGSATLTYNFSEPALTDVPEPAALGFFGLALIAIRRFKRS